MPLQRRLGRAKRNDSGPLMVRIDHQCRDGESARFRVDGQVTVSDFAMRRSRGTVATLALT